MKMPCRMTDEQVYNPSEAFEDDTTPLKSLGDVTIDDLMSNDTYVWVGKNKQYGYLLELENDVSTEPFLREIGLHPFAMESLAMFCRRFLGFYDKLEAAG